MAAECLAVDDTPSRKKFEFELMRQIDQVTSQQFELTEMLKERMSKIDALLEKPGECGPQSPPSDIAPEDEAEWWRRRISELSKPVNPETSRTRPWHGRTFVRAGDCTIAAPPKSKAAALEPHLHKGASVDRLTEATQSEVTDEGL
mmetsp:Transcript_119319/g.283242  ORF Transcript_119319/g.283242 Transcript_119319/m.283242 type:complete len:146 (+) Transcript_119319:30-467(+)